MFDLESLKINLETAEFSITNALRLVSTITSVQQSMELEKEIDGFAESVMDLVQQ